MFSVCPALKLLRQLDVFVTTQGRDDSHCSPSNTRPMRLDVGRLKRDCDTEHSTFLSPAAHIPSFSSTLLLAQYESVLKLASCNLPPACRCCLGRPSPPSLPAEDGAGGPWYSNHNCRVWGGIMHVLPSFYADMFARADVPHCRRNCIVPNASEGVDANTIKRRLYT